MEALSPPQAALLVNHQLGYICDRDFTGYMFPTQDDADAFATELGKGDNPVAFEANHEHHTVKIRKKDIEQIFRDNTLFTHERVSPICHPLFNGVITHMSNALGRLVGFFDSEGPVDYVIDRIAVLPATASKVADFLGSNPLTSDTSTEKKDD